MADASRPSPPPPGPLPIKRLDESLINRIAAGEIIHRPSSALKELVENALDAGATTIKVTVKDGGMKLLQIQDNGCGIRKSDLPQLATRFTTSKLSTFSDLSRLQTYGFRGEALASISHVAHLSVITKTKQDSCAWRANYLDGQLAPAKTGLTAEAKACAGNDGTTITVEDLFHSTPTRLSALRSTSEEYARILDVVTRYAAHNPHVAFVCKKAGAASPDLSTPQSSTIPHTISMLYGHSLGRELYHVDVSANDGPRKRQLLKRRKSDDLDEDRMDDGDGGDDGDDGDDDDERMEIDDTAEEDNPKPTGATRKRRSTKWTAEAYVTSPNYQAKKFIFLLFINHRLVESSRIKRAIEGAYSGLLPKGTSPFVYLSIDLPPHTVDVNVHPTKREVHFLDEETITERIVDVVQKALVSGKAARSRAFEYQTVLASGSAEVQKPKGKGKERAEEAEHEEDPVTPANIRQKKLLSQHKVRTSTQDRTLDSMFPIMNPRQRDTGQLSGSSGNNSPIMPAPTPAARGTQTSKARDAKESECYLTSIRDLRSAELKGKHHQLAEIMENHVFVGVVDIDRGLSLIQHSTRLYLVNHSALAEQLFYQLGLRQFGNFGKLRLDPPPSLRTLVALAVEAEEGTMHIRLTKSQIVNAITSTVLSKRDLLAEYFAMDVSAEGLVESLPILLRGYTPNLDRLPLFLMRLGPQVDWTSESGCFRSFLRELAYFYLPGPLPSAPPASALATSSPRHVAAATSQGAEHGVFEDNAETWQLQHVLFPAMKRYLLPSKNLLDRDVVQVASLPDLYRVFERC